MPTVTHFVFLFLLGGLFLHFVQAAARTFYSDNLQNEPGAMVGQLSFVFGGTVPIWFVGLYHPIHLYNGIAGGAVWLLSLSLYEWARHTIWLRRFGVGWGDHVPETLCIEGPYAYLRHPIYLSYMLAFLAVLIALPHWLTALLFVGNVALFAHAARSDERQLAESPLAAEYAAYRERTPAYIPRISRSAPGR
jgi:protein-S-isoprenylcysteine O-methyltransferase Ste14